MGWVKIYHRDDTGNVTAIEHLGDPDPLDDKPETPKHGYWQNPGERQPQSTVEDEDGL